MTKPTDIHEHLATLFMLTIEFNLKRILELGTREGESTVALLQAAKQINGKVFSIDIDSCLRAKRLIQKYELQKYWEFTQADDLKMKWSTPIDHLFIDTSHTFDQTLRELEKYEPYVRRGGIITMHDIVSSQGVLSAITKYLENRDDLAFYKYFNSNGLGVIFKR
jgi:predicted O-methyltransferase YrrM